MSATHLKMSAYLVLSENGIQRLSKRQPKLEPGEVPMEVSVIVPKALFRRPSLSATLTVQGEATTEISKQVVVDATELLRSNGFDIQIVPQQTGD